MNELTFNIYGFNVRLQSHLFPPNELKASIDFSYFVSNLSGPPHLTIEVKELSQTGKQGWRLARTRMCEVRQIGIYKRQLIFADGSGTLAVLMDIHSEATRQIVIEARDKLIVDDILYFLINSAAGEYLDGKGLVRIHAASWTHKGEGYAVFGLPGSGKSSLALELIKNDEVRLYSDEISLFELSTKKLYPYPIRLSVPSNSPLSTGDSKFNYFFNSKKMIQLPAVKLAEPKTLKMLFWLRPQNTSEVISSVGFFPLFSCYTELLLGRGLLQMAEYMIRANNLPTLLRIFKNRVRLLCYLGFSRVRILNRNTSIDQKLSSLL